MTIGSLAATLTTIGTGTTKTQLNAAKDINLPNDAKELVSVIPYCVPLTPTAAQSTLIKISVESDDVKLTPCEVLTPPIGSQLGGTGQQFIGSLQEWPIHCPLAGGERLKVFGQSLAANTVAVNAGAIVVVSSVGLGKPVRRWKLGALTSTGTTLGDVPGTAFSIAAAHAVKAVFGVVLPTTELASNPVSGYGYMETSDFLSSFPLKWPIQPVGAGLSTLISSMIAGIKVLDTDMPTKPACSLLDHFVLELAPGTAGNFINGIGYE